MGWLRCSRLCGGLTVALACSLDSAGQGGEASSTGGTADSTATGASATTATTATATDTTATGTATGTADSSSGGGGSSSAGTHGSSSDSGSAGESSSGGPLGDFGEPIAVAELNSFWDDDDPSLSADQLEIYFASTRDGIEDIFVARRSAVDEPFDTPTVVLELSDLSIDSTPELSADGLFISFASDRPFGEGGLDVWVSTRTDRQSAWSTPMSVLELSSIDAEGSAVMTADALTVYLCRYFLPPEEDQILISTRAANFDLWAEPAVVAGLQADGRDCTPWVDASGSELWWASTRAGGEGLEDIYRVDLVDGAPSGEPEAIAAINDDSRDEDPWLSPQGDVIYFSSTRAGMGQDIFMAVRE